MISSDIKEIELLREKTKNELLLEKYTLSGRILKKTINNKNLYYYKYVDEFYNLVSVCLTTKELDICKKEEENKKRLVKLIDMLNKEVLSFNITKIDIISNNALHENTANIRILEEATGISRKYHLLFYIIPEKKYNRYRIHILTKKKEHIIPMIFVDESDFRSIPFYVQSASCMVDKYVEDMNFIKIYPSYLSKTNGIYKTQSGLEYFYQKNGSGYDVCFYLNEKKINFNYKLIENEFTECDIINMGFIVERKARKILFKEEVEQYAKSKNIYIET